MGRRRLRECKEEEEEEQVDEDDEDENEEDEEDADDVIYANISWTNIAFSFDRIIEIVPLNGHIVNGLYVKKKQTIRTIQLETPYCIDYKDGKSIHHPYTILYLRRTADCIVL